MEPQSNTAGARRTGRKITPQREAAFFYGLFLRGHSADELRRDIAVSQDVRARWKRMWRDEPVSQEYHLEMLQYRSAVLAIFDTLVRNDRTNSRLPQ